MDCGFLLFVPVTAYAVHLGLRHDHIQPRTPGLYVGCHAEQYVRRWHAEHQELYVRKRIAVAEWRSQKDAQKAALAAEAYLEPATARQAQEQRRQQQQQDYSHMWVVAAMRFAAIRFAIMRFAAMRFAALPFAALRFAAMCFAAMCFAATSVLSVLLSTRVHISRIVHTNCGVDCIMQ